MVLIFINRIFRAIKIDPDLYEEVEHDKSATIQAAGVVVLSSLAAGVGAIHLGASNFLLGPLLSLASWYFWAFIIYMVGTKLFPPGLIRVFAFTPELMTVTFVGSSLWMLACMVVAVKQALDYKSLWRALGVVIVSWLIQAFLLLLILLIFR